MLIKWYNARIVLSRLDKYYELLFVTCNERQFYLSPQLPLYCEGNLPSKLDAFIWLLVLLILKEKAQFSPQFYPHVSSRLPHSAQGQACLLRPLCSTQVVPCGGKSSSLPTMLTDRQIPSSDEWLLPLFPMFMGQRALLAQILIIFGFICLLACLPLSPGRDAMSPTSFFP